MEQKRFRLVLSAEVKKFIEQLPKPAMKKVIYNIDRVAGGERNNELFKKLDSTDIWGSVHSIIKQHIVSLPFGIQTKKRLSSQLME